MSKLIVPSPRGTANVEIKTLRRAGSVYGVGFLLNGNLLDIVQPEGYPALAQWLRDNAAEVEKLITSTTAVADGPVEEEG